MEKAHLQLSPASSAFDLFWIRTLFAHLRLLSGEQMRCLNMNYVTHIFTCASPRITLFRHRKFHNVLRLEKELKLVLLCMGQRLLILSVKWLNCQICNSLREDYS